MADWRQILAGTISGTLQAKENQYQAGVKLQQQQTLEEWKLQKRAEYAELARNAQLDWEKRTVGDRAGIAAELETTTANLKATDPKTLETALINAGTTAQATVAGEEELMRGRAGRDYQEASLLSQIETGKTTSAAKHAVDEYDLNNPKAFTNAVRRKVMETQAQFDADAATEPLRLIQAQWEAEAELRKVIATYDGVTAALADRGDDSKMRAVISKVYGVDLTKEDTAGMAVNMSPAQVDRQLAYGATSSTLAFHDVLDAQLDTEWAPVGSAKERAKLESEREALRNSITKYSRAVLDRAPETAGMHYNDIQKRLRAFENMKENNPLKTSGALLDLTRQQAFEFTRFGAMASRGMPVTTPTREEAFRRGMAWITLPDGEERRQTTAWFDGDKTMNNMAEAAISAQKDTPPEPLDAQEDTQEAPLLGPPQEQAPQEQPSGFDAASEAYAPPQQVAYDPGAVGGMDAYAPPPPQQEALLPPAPQVQQAPAPQVQQGLTPEEMAAVPPEPVPQEQAPPVEGALLADEGQPVPIKPYEYPNYGLPAPDDLEGNMSKFVDDMVGAVESASLKGAGITDEKLMNAFLQRFKSKVDKGIFPQEQAAKIQEALWTEFKKRMNK